MIPMADSSWAEHPAHPAAVWHNADVPPGCGVAPELIFHMSPWENHICDMIIYSPI